MILTEQALSDWIDEHLPQDVPEHLVSELSNSDFSKSQKLEAIVKCQNPESRITADEISNLIGNRALIKILGYYDGLELA